MPQGRRGRRGKGNLPSSRRIPAEPHGRPNDQDRWWRAGVVATRDDRPVARQDRLQPRRAVLEARVNWHQRPASSPSTGGPPPSAGGPAAATGILLHKCGWWCAGAVGGMRAQWAAPCGRGVQWCAVWAHRMK
jgi:hypothetical protein